MRMTEKQLQIMEVVMKGNQDEDGVTVSWCDVYEVMERLPYTSSREAVICSMKFLAKKGMVEVKKRWEIRNGRRRTVYIPTNMAFDTLVKAPVSIQELLSMSLS